MEAFQPLPSENGNCRVDLLDQNGAYVPSVRMCDLGRQLADRVVGDEELGQAIARETRERVPGRHWRYVKKNARHPWGYYLHESHADTMLSVARDTSFIEEARKTLTRNKSIAANRKKVRLREEQIKMSTSPALPFATYEALGNVSYRSIPVEAIVISIKLPMRDGTHKAEIEVASVNGVPHLYMRSLERAFRPEVHSNANLLRALRNRTGRDDIATAIRLGNNRGREGFALPWTMLDDILGATPPSLHMDRKVQEHLKGELERICRAWDSMLAKPTPVTPFTSAPPAPAAVDPFPPAPAPVEAPKRSASEMFDRLERMEQRLDQALGENAMLLGRIDQFTTIFGQLKTLVGVNAQALNDYRDFIEAVAKERPQAVRLVSGARS